MTIGDTFIYNIINIDAIFLCYFDNFDSCTEVLYTISPRCIILLETAVLGTNNVSWLLKQQYII